MTDKPNLDHLDISPWAKEPDLSYTPDLAYILGVLAGDGCVTEYEKPSGRKDRRIALGTIDLPLAEYFSDKLESIGLNPRITKREDERFKQGHDYLVEANSTVFYQWYKSIDTDDVGDIATRTRNNAWYFLAGVYESDGSLATSVHNDNPQTLKINTSDADHRDLYLDVFEYLGYAPWVSTDEREQYTSGEYHTIGISDQRKVKVILEEMNPCIERKTGTFDAPVGVVGRHNHD